ncbi:DsbA family oxidoreductase [Paraburkholderia sp. BR13439]|uniref:DsbA family oxidoreductase n=1 Tax=Paraburkholderia sp. BR13439 TaxID=3236996 RepID=UPI0034CDCFD5
MTSSDQNMNAQACSVRGERSVLKIETFFDFVCPWCLIGKRNLDVAVSRFESSRPDVRVSVQWRSHQLLPGVPVEGLPYQAFYRDRLGSAEAVAARRAQVQRAGDDAGIKFAFDRIEVMPNTAAAHALVTYAASRGTGVQITELIDRILTAYFMEGENIGDTEVLARLGHECGLEYTSLTANLAASKHVADLNGQRTSHGDAQVSGVPHFVFNTRYSLSGVYSPVALASAMALAVAN